MSCSRRPTDAIDRAVSAIEARRAHAAWVAEFRREILRRRAEVLDAIRKEMSR